MSEKISLDSSEASTKNKTANYSKDCNWLLRFYLPCSSCKVLVGWSQTSVGPKYWIGPG